MQQSLDLEDIEQFGGEPDHQGANEPEIVPPINIIRNYLNEAQQQALIDEALDYPLTSPEIEVFGKKVAIPRSQVWFGDQGCDYLFSSLFIKALPWPKYALKLRRKLERDFSCCFNGALVNYYADGRQSVGWHSDDEPEIYSDSDIASVTLGASRDFIVRHKKTDKKITLQLNSGDLLMMLSPMQQQWQHCLPKRLKVTAPRINFTFRHLIKGFHN